MRASRLGAAVLAGVLTGAPAVSVAQTAPVQSPAQSPVQSAPSPTPPGLPTVTLQFGILDQDRLFNESRLGQQILTEIRANERQLEAENQQIFDQLEAEELALTEQRTSLTPEAFRALADAFDARVETIRTERAASAQALFAANEQRAQQFFDAALPILLQMMADEGILALLNPDVLVLGIVDELDITDRAIERLDAAFAATQP